MATGSHRALLVVADDFGIGPPTTAGILHLAGKGVVSATVLLVNSPYATDAVALWNRAGRPMDLGWHPNLTLDAPIMPAALVPSLVNPQGKFWPLPVFLRRWLLGRMEPREIEAEFRAQLLRFREMVGQPPALVNAHQHIIVFPPLGNIILDVMRRQGCFPYVRRVREPWRMQWQVPGARLKRWLLNTLGRRQSRRQDGRGFPGSDWLAGVTDPPWVRDPRFHHRWLSRMPGQVVELVCHPGFEDRTLVGRDCVDGDGLMQWRVDELTLLDRPEFFEAVAAAGFRIISPTQWLQRDDPHADAA
jgi:predicted glycoside hydrolase/deacetylase ChbG (UPF0249 family)